MQINKASAPSWLHLSVLPLRKFAENDYFSAASNDYRPGAANEKWSP